jgi:regulator of sigma E protease
MSYLIAIAGLLVLVLIHELGHFGATKLVGMRAVRFSIGFPPLIARKQVGDTEYALGAIPLGGYVKIPGMNRPEAGDLWEVGDLLERGEGLPEHDRAAIGIVYDEVSRDLAQARVDAAAARLGELRRVIAEADPHLTERDRKRLERMFERFEQSTDPRAYWRCKPWQRLVVILAGPAMNVVAAFLILMVVGITGKPQPAKPIPAVAAVIAKSPALDAGLKAGDRIVVVNGTQVRSFDDVRAQIERSAGGPITVTVRRDGRNVRLPAERPYRSDGRWLFGFQPDVRYSTRSVSVWHAPQDAASTLWHMTSGTVTALGNLGSSTGRGQVSSTVGIVRYTADVADIGAAYYLTVIALISLSLAIFNMLPLLPLDGGHVLFIIVEKLRGRPISRGGFERASAVGIALILVLFVIGLQNDLSSIIGTSNGP